VKCSKCQFENPEGTKFCGGCGSKLEKTCPKCGQTNPSQFKFCGECGQTLDSPAAPAPKKLSLDGKISKIQRYLPQGLTDKILSQRDRIEGEKRQVTVLFCDMVGFTPLSEKLGPEGVYSLMDEVYEILIHKVNDYGGTVNELTGDGIMALFGAPIALEDAPQRAIRSALAIHREITRFSERLTRGKGIPPIRIRAGIHSGPVVVGTVGNNLRVEFKAIGDTVNLASRMESIAESGTTYVTEDTFRLTEGLFRFENLGEKEIKGKAAPVRVYRVLAPSTRRTRFDVSAERGLTTFVGRERELELLLDGFDRAKEGNGQAFSIVGEAGIGKSRFVYEFRKAVSNEDITFLEGKCLSYGRGVPYHPIADVLKGNFEIGEDDTDVGIRGKVSRGLEALKADEATTLPYLLEILSIKDSGVDRISMSPEGRRERMIEAVKQIILKGSQIRPLIITIEDLHWADQSTEYALKLFLDAVPGARVLIIFTYRPEFVHTWGGRSFHNQITLNRLSNRESLRMVSHLFEADAFDPELERLILGKTEGIPFFIEEFVRSLRDLGAIKREEGKVLLQAVPQSVSIPSTIQDMIMARVDRLPDETKAVLQAGSAIEREFPHELIRTLTGLSETELFGHLSALKDSELIYERGIYPTTSYIFRHALTREVVYASILSRRRKELHGEIARAIEEMHKDDLAGDYEVLAYHYFEGENYTKSAGYFRRAARKAEKASSLPDAIAHTEKSLLCLEKLPDSESRVKELIDARTVLGLYLSQINHHVEAREAVEPVAVLAREKNYRKRLGHIQTVLGSYYQYVDEDHPRASLAFEEALGIAGEEKDIVTLVLSSVWLGSMHGYDCDFEKSRESFQRAVDINIAANSLWGIAASKASMAIHCHFYAGRIKSSMELASEALRIAQESGDPYSKGSSFASYGIACFAKRLLDDAKVHLLEGRNLCERVGLYSWAAPACAYLASSYFEMKEYQKARECFHESIKFCRRVRIFPSWITWAELGMARCAAMLGETDVKLESLRAIPKKNRIKAAEGMVYRYMGEILLNLGESHVAEAEECMRKAIEADARNGMSFELGLDHAVYAEFFKRQANRTKAQEEFGKAVGILRECGADGWVEKYERELAVLR
jgi:predicted ATPase/class 3 adenylate cyclase